MNAGETLATEKRCTGELDARADALRALSASGIPFVVAGAYAFFEYTGIFRDTKDLDVFLRRRDLEAAFETLSGAGFRCEMEDEVWIGKAFRGEWFVDLIFSSGNGVAVVDDAWFEHAREREVMGVPVLIAPPEEIIWSKGFVCERERYDGHDVSNLIRSVGHEMSWERLLDRFADHWEVLLSHLVMYRFAFPGERSQVPRWVMEELLRRTSESVAEGNGERRVCRGRLVSRTQYEHAVHQLGYDDARAEVIALARGGSDDVAELPTGRRR
jgi:glutaredoxin-related protein